MADRILTSATLSPASVLAGDSAEFVITLTIGEDYTRNESRIG